MTYIAQLFTLTLALLGAFYKNTQKRIGGDPVYWHIFPVLTPIGWILVTALFLSSGISVYSAYEKTAMETQAKADETTRANTLQTTLNEVNSTSALTLKTQIKRFEDILTNQETIGNTTIGKISDSSKLLTTTIDDSSTLLTRNINGSATLLRGNINEASNLTRNRMLEVALAGRSSVPQMYLFFGREGVAQYFASMDEQDLVKDRSFASIGFIPQSVRDVLFPFSDNSPGPDNTSIGHIDFRIGHFGAFCLVQASGFVGRASVLFNSIVALDTTLPNSKTPPDSNVRLIFQFKQEWSWEDIDESLNNAFIQGRPIIIVYRDHVLTAPAKPPSFTHFDLVMVLSKTPAFNVSVSLEPRNYRYDSQTQSYSYELHISKAPEITIRPLAP